MPAQKKRAGAVNRLPVAADAFGERGHVLRVVQHHQIERGLVGVDAGNGLLHLVALKAQPWLFAMPRERGRGNGVPVQHGPDLWVLAVYCQMKRGFGRGLALPLQLAIHADHQQVSTTEPVFVGSGCGDPDALGVDAGRAVPAGCWAVAGRGHSLSAAYQGGGQGFDLGTRLCHLGALRLLSGG